MTWHRWTSPRLAPKNGGVPAHLRIAMDGHLEIAGADPLLHDFFELYRCFLLLIHDRFLVIPSISWLHWPGWSLRENPLRAFKRNRFPRNGISDLTHIPRRSFAIKAIREPPALWGSELDVVRCAFRCRFSNRGCRHIGGRP
jgi:hypothetical protein